MIRLFPIASFALLTVIAAMSSPPAARAATPLGCSGAPSAALAAIADALTQGPDARVLVVSRIAVTHLRACGFSRDAVSAELVAADAYGDVNQPARRCDALRDARARSKALGDTSRAAAIGKALAGC